MKTKILSDLLSSKSDTSQVLNGKKIAILATDGVEQVELTEPRKALVEAGAEVTLISLKTGEIQMWNHQDKGDKVEVDMAITSAQPENFDGLVLPGGVANPDTLRTNEAAVEFVRSLAAREMPIASICHGPWMLIEADLVKGVSLTSWPSLKTDLMNAGAKWEDSTVVVDGQFITSRKPSDLSAFNREMIKRFASGITATEGLEQTKHTQEGTATSVHHRLH